MELDPEKEPVIQTVRGVRRFTVVHLLRWECYFRGSNSEGSLGFNIGGQFACQGGRTLGLCSSPAGTIQEAGAQCDCVGCSGQLGKSLPIIYIG